MEELLLSLWGLVEAIGGLAEGADLGEVELLEAEVAEGVESVVHAEVFVGEAGAGGVSECSKGFD